MLQPACCARAGVQVGSRWGFGLLCLLSAMCRTLAARPLSLPHMQGTHAHAPHHCWHARREHHLGLWVWLQAGRQRKVYHHIRDLVLPAPATGALACLPTAPAPHHCSCVSLSAMAQCVVSPTCARSGCTSLLSSNPSARPGALEHACVPLAAMAPCVVSPPPTPALGAPAFSQQPISAGCLGARVCPPVRNGLMCGVPPPNARSGCTSLLSSNPSARPGALEHACVPLSAMAPIYVHFPCPHWVRAIHCRMARIGGRCHRAPTASTTSHAPPSGHARQQGRGRGGAG